MPVKDEAPAVVAEEAPAPIKMVTMKLERNYRPAGPYEIVGYLKEAVTKKNSAGMIVELEKAEFIKGEAKPPAIAGTGYPGKLWAGTVINIGEAEGRNIRRIGIASLEFAD